jgi:hypothetical protein
MAKPDGRIEKGQRLSTAISARAWNRAQDAADIVLGVRPGVEAGDVLRRPPHRIIVTMRKELPSQAIYPGHAIEFQLHPQSWVVSSYLEASTWPADGSTFQNTLNQIDERQTTDARKQEERERYASFLGSFAPTYTCQLMRPTQNFNGQEVDFFPNIGVAVAESAAGNLGVSVCISGPALVYIRYLSSIQFAHPNACAIRPRVVSGVAAPFSNAVGCLDAHRGGNIKVLHMREIHGAAPSFPCMLLTPVML